MYWCKSGMDMSCWWLMILTCSLGAGVQITWSLMLISTTGVEVGCDGWWSCAKTGVVPPATFMTTVSWLTGSRSVVSQTIKAQFIPFDYSPSLLTVGDHTAIVSWVRALAVCTFPLVPGDVNGEVGMIFLGFGWERSWLLQPKQYCLRDSCVLLFRGFEFL